MARPDSSNHLPGEDRMRPLILALFIALVATPALAQSNPPDLAIKGGQVVAGPDQVVLEKAQVQPVDHSELRFIALGDEDAAPAGRQGGLYLFDPAGKLIAFALTPEAEFCFKASLSPGGKILAMDAGTYLIRSWIFFDAEKALAPTNGHPQEMALLDNDVTYYQPENQPDLIWDGDQGVLFSYLDDRSGPRPCDYDPCGPISVMRHDFATGKTLALFEGTDLCDYSLVSFKDKVVTAKKLCQPSKEAWKTFPQNLPTEQVSITLPQ